MTDPYLNELSVATEALNTARRCRYEALSAALAVGHPQQVVASAASMSPPSLSRMIRQDAARPPGSRLLPGLRTGEVDGKPVRWFVAALPRRDLRVGSLTVSEPQPARNRVSTVNYRNPKV